METLAHVAALFIAAVGATWALRTKLADIELAIKGHVSQDDKIHGDHLARIIKLEKRRK